MKRSVTQKNILKKATFAAAFILGISFSNNTIAQSWQWATGANGSSSDNGGSACTDASGNMITTGNFSSNPLQLGSFVLNNSGGTDAYIAKANPSGTILWASKIGGANNESISGVCTDASGNIYVHGSFNSPFITVSATTISNFTTSLTYDVFVACFNSSGLLQWMKSFGGVKDENAGGCVFSNSLSCLYITGSFHSASVVAGTNTITNSDASGANNDLFLARLTNTGSVTWIKSAGSSTSQDAAQQVVIDSNSDPYFNGSFAPTSGVTTTIGSTLLTTYGGQDMILVKYTSAGVPVFAKNYGSNINCTCDFAGGIAIDASNNIFLSGTYTGASLVAGTNTLTNSGGYDCFVAKTNSVGVFQWVSKIGAGGDQYANSVATDNGGNVYVTGSSSGTTVVVGTTTLTNSTPGTSTDIFVLKYNTSGTTQWGLSAAGANTDEQGNSITTDGGGNIYVSGNIFTSPTVFGTTTVTGTGSTDAFIARISCLTTSVTGVATVCTGSSATLTAVGATSYTWSTGATGTSIVITPTANTTYSVLASIGTCTGASAPYNVMLLPASLNTGPALNLLCNQSQIINATCSPASPTLVTWTPSAGLSAANVLTPTILATAAPVQYSVTVNLNNGCAVKGTVNFTRYAPKPDICLATVDTLGMNNDIFWEKTLYTNVDSFIVYREVTTNVFKRIAAISNNAYSGFTDTVRSIGPANGDPNTTSYKYKLQIRDVCGNYSALSLWHQTIFIQDQQNGNFNWNPYAIESSGTPITVYDLYRVNIANSTYSLVTSTTAGFATDPQYNAWQNTAKWRVQANGFNCNPTPRFSSVLDLKIKTKSNIKNDKLAAPQGIHSYGLLNDVISVYPSPAKDAVFINSKALANVDFVIEVQNALGQILYNKKVDATTTENYQVDLSTYVSGVYFVNIKLDNKTTVVKKIVVSK